MGLIRFDFHLHPPLSRSLSTSCQPNHSLNLKIDGGLFDFLLSQRAQREQSSLAGRHEGRDRASRYSRRHVGVKCSR